MTTQPSNSNTRLNALAETAEAMCQQSFKHIDATAQANAARVLSAFSNNRVSDAMFHGTTGYGYNDLGRDTLDKIYAEVFGAEDALVRLQLVSGTHAITCALFGVLTPGQTLISATGVPYDTVQAAIGISGDYPGTLIEFGIKYKQIELLEDGALDLAAIEKAVRETDAGAVFLQRSRGYFNRPTVTIDVMRDFCSRVKAINPNINIIVDNCYGEFVETCEPTGAGADITAGSLIKNPGGALAPTGGYIAGRRDLIERAAARLTVPGIGRECGSTLGNNRLLYQGFFTAPHVVAQALKTAVFSAALFELLGFEVSPRHDEIRYDIIQTIELKSAARVKAFCEGVQQGAPVDSYVTPIPWEMPGYSCPVIMAAGSFIQGASIELSADAPMREPFRVYLQGGITYESGKVGILKAAETLMDSE